MSNQDSINSFLDSMDETPADRFTAVENHGLVYSFFKERNLPEDKYYDTVIFAFLDCVIKNTDVDFKTRPMRQWIRR